MALKVVYPALGVWELMNEANLSIVSGLSELCEIRIGSFRKRIVRESDYRRSPNQTTGEEMRICHFRLVEG